MVNFSKKLSRPTKNGSNLTVDYGDEFVEMVKRATGKDEVSPKDIELFIHEALSGAIQNYAKNGEKSD